MCNKSILKNTEVKHMNLNKCTQNLDVKFLMAHPVYTTTCCFLKDTIFVPKDIFNQSINNTSTLEHMSHIYIFLIDMRSMIW